MSDVLNVNKDGVEELPELGNGIDTTFIAGMARSGEQLITLLNIDNLLTRDLAA